MKKILFLIHFIKAWIKGKIYIWPRTPFTIQPTMHMELKYKDIKNLFIKNGWIPFCIQKKDDSKWITTFLTLETIQKNKRKEK